MKVKVRDLVFDRTIYPREEVNNATVEAYKMAMEAGAEFPPIEIQRVYNYDDSEDETLLITNGVHRWTALDGNRAKVDVEIEAEHWRDDAIDYETSWFELNLRSLELAKRQGKNLVKADKKAQCRRLAEADPDVTIKQKEFAEWFDVKQPAISKWIKDIRTRQEAGRESIILKLDLLGWTQEEIGQAVGLSQPQVTEIIGNIPRNKIDNFLADGKSIDEAAKFAGYDLPLTYALMLRDYTDAEVMEEIDISPRPYDVWNFPKCHDMFGRDHPGRIPGQLIANLLYFFTERGDCIIDPMVGGGTTLDVALVMGRRCFGYDIDLRHDRGDVIKWDMEKGWPDKTKKADLIFIDAPYYKAKEAEYAEGSISDLGRDDYMKAWASLFASAYPLVKAGTTLAFLNVDWTGDYEGRPGAGEHIFIDEYSRLAIDAGWLKVRQISAPIPTQQISGDLVNKYREQKKLARLARYLVIFKKIKGA